MPGKRARSAVTALAPPTVPRFHPGMPWQQRGKAVQKLWSKAERQEQSGRFPRLRKVTATFSVEAFVALPSGRLHPLAYLIADRGLSPVAAAKHLGIDPGLLERVVGWRAPMLEPARSRLAAAFGVDAGELFPEPPRSRPSFE